MFTRHNQGKFLLSLVVGMIFLSMIFANCLTARAEDSSQIIIKESSEHTIKPVVRPSRKNINTKYKVKVGPVKRIAPQNQNQGLDKSNRTHGISSLSAEDSKFKTEIKIIPIKKISPVTSEGLKITDGDRSRRQRPLPEGTGISGTIGPIKKISPETSEGLKVSDGKDGRRQRSFPERSGIVGKIQKKSISISKDNVRPEREYKTSIKTGSIISDQMDNIKKRISKSKEVTVMPIDQTEKGDKKYEIKAGPNKVVETENAKKSQSPLRERIKVTRVRAWKLDESGKKTNEKIIDDNNVIKGINQPPSE